MDDHGRQIVVFLSLVLLVRSAGQVSPLHVAFMAVGAVGFSHLTVLAGLPCCPRSWSQG